MRDDSTNGQLVSEVVAPARRQIKPLPRKFSGLDVYQPRDIRQYKGWSTCISGRGGVGKSTLAASVINSELAWNCIFVDIEGGAVVLDDAEDNPKWRPEEGPHLGIVNVQDWSTLNTVMDNTIATHKSLDINCVIFDNMGEAIELSKHARGFYKAGAANEFGIWDDITNDMIGFFRRGRDLARQEQFICIFVMWDTEKLMVRNDPHGGYKRDLALNPKTAEKVMGVMDSCIWLETPPRPRTPYPPILHFTDIDPAIPTKKRLNPKQQRILNIPDVIYNPDLGVIVDSILGGQKFPIENHADKPSARNMQEILASRKTAPVAPGTSSGTNQ